MSNYQRFLLIGLLLLSSGCGTTVVLNANFNADAVGAPPASTQSVGTVRVNRGDGEVVVVAAPDEHFADQRWVRISHPASPSRETELLANCTTAGPGRYGLLTRLFIPSGAGVVTVQFEAVNGVADFFHLDFMPEGNVRVDDGTLRFGSFPRDQAFLLSVVLTITNTGATAAVELLSGGTGSTTVTIQPPFTGAARQFGAIRFWVGFEHRATFFVDDILVTRRN
ncbi:MAG TPA: hypothetical protein VJ276_06695 [Thermoanaerobaculia bacterium]|nr:hypothetical protein [Thermoanaerobaculia bacterium]